MTDIHLWRKLLVPVLVLKQRSNWCGWPRETDGDINDINGICYACCR